MGKLIRVPLLLLTAAGLIPAQQDTPAPQLQRQEQRQQRLDEIKERLKLTPEQEEQVRPILAGEFAQFKEVRDKHKGSDMSRREKRKMGRELKSIRDDADEKLKKILSKQQMEELKTIRKEMREQMKQQRANNQ